MLAGLSAAYLTALMTLVAWAILPLLWGWSTYVTQSGSMAPAVATGDALITSPDTSHLVRRQIVVVDDPSHPGELLSHRIDRVRQDGAVVTKGDANAHADSTPVSRDDVHGVARLRIPFVGLPQQWWNARDLLPLLLWTLGTTAAVILAMTDPLLRSPLVPAREDPGLSDSRL